MKEKIMGFNPKLNYFVYELRIRNNEMSAVVINDKF